MELATTELFVIKLFAFTEHFPRIISKNWRIGLFSYVSGGKFWSFEDTIFTDGMLLADFGTGGRPPPN